MKIAQVAPFFFPVEGGMERHVYYLSKQLLFRHKSYSLSVVTCNRDHKNNLINSKHEEIKGINVYRQETKFKKSFITYFPSLNQRLESLDPDIIHVHAYRHPHVKIALKYAKKHNKKIVFTPYAIFNDSASLPLKNRIYYKLYDTLLSGKRFLSKFDSIIALTHFEKDRLIKLGAPASKISVIPCGGCSFSPISQDKSSKNKEPDLDKLFKGLEGKFILGSLSRIHPSKGLDTLIESLAKIKDLDWVYLMVGPDPNNYLKTLLSKAAHLGVLKKIVYLGPINYKKKQFFEGLDLFISPSKAEALGMTLVEAQSLGIPSIGSNFPPIREVVLHGKTGFLVDYGDITSLSENIKLLIENKKLHKDLSRAAKHYSSQWSWKNLTDCIEKVYAGEQVDFYKTIK
jgi:glycosyltransferase involved in cell wall biosynthesis